MRHSAIRLTTWSLAAMLALGLVPVSAEDDADNTGWEYYGATPHGTRYVALDQITPDNVQTLELAWTYDPGERERRGEELYANSSNQNTPTLVAGHLLVCTPFNRLIGLDPVTGEERWVHDASTRGDNVAPFHYNCRGVTPWTDPEMEADAQCATRVIMPTNDATLVAVDPRTGKACSGFGNAGVLDLPLVLDGFAPGELKLTSAPVVVNGVLVTGSVIMDNLRVDAPPGTVFGFDVRTGDLLWTWEPIPRDTSDPAYATWENDSALKNNAANVWSTMVVDEARNLVFLPTSSASPDFWGGERPGDNLYTSSIVALDGATGKVVWHFQHVHHDIWDWDTSSPPLVIDIRRDNKVIPAVVQNTKQGFVFVLNRETGEPIFGVEERPVPQVKEDGEYLSPTQPFPVLPRPLVRNEVTPDDAWGFSFLDRNACRQKIADSKFDGMFTAPSEQGTIIAPGNAGGANWGGPAYDPVRQWMFVNLNNVAQVTKLIPRVQMPDLQSFALVDGKFVMPQLGTPYVVVNEWLLSPFGAPCTPPPWGKLVAIDMTDGSVKWDVPFGDIKGILPSLFRDLPFSWNLGTPSIGGPIVTRGGVLFIGGSMDQFLRAYSMDSGEELWRFDINEGISTTPMTYEAGGRQFVVIVSGNHTYFQVKGSGRVWAFALPKE